MCYHEQYSTSKRVWLVVIESSFHYPIRFIEYTNKLCVHELITSLRNIRRYNLALKRENQES